MSAFCHVHHVIYVERRLQLKLRAGGSTTSTSSLVFPQEQTSAVMLGSIIKILHKLVQLSAPSYYWMNVLLVLTSSAVFRTSSFLIRSKSKTVCTEQINVSKFQRQRWKALEIWYLLTENTTLLFCKHFLQLTGISLDQQIHEHESQGFNERIGSMKRSLESAF